MFSKLCPHLTKIECTDVLRSCNFLTIFEDWWSYGHQKVNVIYCAQPFWCTINCYVRGHACQQNKQHSKFIYSLITKLSEKRHNNDILKKAKENYHFRLSIFWPVCLFVCFPFHINNTTEQIISSKIISITAVLQTVTISLIQLQI